MSRRAPVVRTSVRARPRTRWLGGPRYLVGPDGLPITPEQDRALAKSMATEHAAMDAEEVAFERAYDSARPRSTDEKEFASTEALLEQLEEI